MFSVLTGTCTVVVESTTTTTLAPAVTAYLSDLEGLVIEAEGLLERARTINTEWDNRTATFNDTADLLRALATDTSSFETRVQAAATVAELEASHLLLNEAAAGMSTAATGMGGSHSGQRLTPKVQQPAELSTAYLLAQVEGHGASVSRHLQHLEAKAQWRVRWPLGRAIGRKSVAALSSGA